MTQPQAEKVANIILGAAAVGAAFYILKTPPLRRVAFGLLRTALAGTGPAWLLAEAKRGWQESARVATRSTAL